MGQPRGSVAARPWTTRGSSLPQSYFAFEVESPVGTLKEVPIWDELEQMLDNPYQFALDPSVRGNLQGWPSYRSTQERRRSFIYRTLQANRVRPPPGLRREALAGHVIHPLNYNFQSGEELRLLNINFAVPRTGRSRCRASTPRRTSGPARWGTNPDGTPIYQYD
jgi:hypothetical protein